LSSGKEKRDIKGNVQAVDTDWQGKRDVYNDVSIPDKEKDDE